MNYKKIVQGIIAASIVGSLGYFGYTSFYNKQVVVKVGEENITNGDLKKRLKTLKVLSPNVKNTVNVENQLVNGMKFYTITKNSGYLPSTDSELLIELEKFIKSPAHQEKSKNIKSMLGEKDYLRLFLIPNYMERFLITKFNEDEEKQKESKEKAFEILKELSSKKVAFKDFAKQNKLPFRTGFISEKIGFSWDDSRNNLMGNNMLSMMQAMAAKGNLKMPPGMLEKMQKQAQNPAKSPSLSGEDLPGAKLLLEGDFKKAKEGQVLQNFRESPVGYQIIKYVKKKEEPKLNEKVRLIEIINVPKANYRQWFVEASKSVSIEKK